MRLLRWTLPNSGVAYSKQDGTVNARDLSFYLKVPLEEIMEAIAPTGDDKIRLIAIQMLSFSTEVRIGCLGGHGFQVYAPPGHCLIPFSKYPISITPLVHETDAADSILASECLSAMEQIGGINFCPRKAGGYRSRAHFVVQLNHQQLNQVLGHNIVFFENRFTGLVFGMGAWSQAFSYWDGKIPLKFATIKKKANCHKSRAPRYQ